MERTLWNISAVMASDDVALSRRPGVARYGRVFPSPRRHPIAVSWTAAAGQRVCRKYRRSRFDVGRLQLREYDKLRRIVPALSVLDTANQRRPRRVSKVTASYLLSISKNSRCCHCLLWIHNASIMGLQVHFTSSQVYGCIVWNAHHTVFGSKSSSSCAQAIYFCIRRCLVPRACDWVMSVLSAMSLIYSFQFRPAFLLRRSARRHSGVLGLPNIGHRTSPKIWGCFLYGAYMPRHDFELILTVKMETRHTVKGSFGSEFQSIYNQCGIMDSWSIKTLKCFQKFLHFLEKRPLTVKFSNFADGKSVKSYVAYLTKIKFRLALWLSILRGSRPKSAGASSRQCTQSAPDFIQICSLSAEL